MQSKTRKRMITIQVEAELAEMLKDRGRMGDTYSVVIRRLLNGSKGDADENRGVTRDEPAGDSDQKKG